MPAISIAGFFYYMRNEKAATNTLRSYFFAVKKSAPFMMRLQLKN
jgi:hypothetical protein